MAQIDTIPQTDLAEHVRTYRAFVRGVLIIVALVSATLVTLAWLFL
jgi:hypothetical protein